MSNKNLSDYQVSKEVIGHYERFMNAKVEDITQGREADEFKRGVVYFRGLMKEAREYVVYMYALDLTEEEFKREHGGK